MFNKEPVIVIGTLAEIVRGIIPVLLVFGYITWNDSQIGQAMLLIGIMVGAAEKLFARSQVYNSNSIQTAKQLEKELEKQN